MFVYISHYQIQQILDEAAAAESAKAQPTIKTEIRRSKTKNEEPEEQNMEFEISNIEIPNRDYADYLDESKEVNIKYFFAK